MSFITRYISFDFPSVAYQQSISLRYHQSNTSLVIHGSRLMDELIY